MYAYSNNGFSFRAWTNPDDLADGEVFFDHAPTEDELDAAFSGYKANEVKREYQVEARLLSETYNSDISALHLAWLAATITDGEGENSLKEDIVSEIADCKAQYASDLAALKVKYGV